MAKNGHPETNQDEQSLTSQQELAVDLLASGRTVTQTADALQVARQTVSLWRNQHHAFIAALNERRQELWDSASDKLRALVPTALEVLETELASGKDKVNAAAHVLKACGLTNLPRPSGPTTVEEAKLDEEQKKHLQFIKAVSVGLSKAKHD